MSYFRDLVNDNLFVRVCVALFSLLVSGLFSLPLLFVEFAGGFWDVISFLICLTSALGGIYIFFVCLFSTDARLEKLMSRLDPSGADIVGLLFVGLVLILVGIVAIPITMIIRFFMPRSIALDFLKSERKKNNEQK